MRLDSGEVVIIGGGVSGLSSGWRLARAGVHVVVLEKGVIGWEASGRNGGAFGLPMGSSIGDDIAARTKELLVIENLDRWETMDDELGYPTEYTPGAIRVAMDDEQLVSMRRNYEPDLAFGHDYRLLDPTELREMVPLVSPDATGAQYVPRGGHANPQRTVQAYAWALQDHGGRIYQHTVVTGFTVEGDRVVAVETDRGTVEADFVVSAAGPQTAQVCEMVGALVPVSPGRVEIVVTEPLPLMPEGNVSGGGLYGRQTRRGNLIFGGGNPEWVEVDPDRAPDKPNTPLVRNIARRLATLLPGAATARLIRSWSGVVEQVPDYLPIIDTLDRPSNFTVVTMSADGFGISPTTGAVVSEMVLHGEYRSPIDDLGLSRFAGTPSDWREQRGWTPTAG